VLRAPDPAIIVSPLAHESVSDLYINMLLLQYVLVFKQDMTIDILHTRCLTEVQKLIVNETMSERIQLVNVLKIVLAFVIDEVLHKVVSAEGTPRPARPSSEKTLRVRLLLKVLSAGLEATWRCAAACAACAEIPLTNMLVLNKLKSRAASS
jgi:hypothetical protein